VSLVGFDREVERDRRDARLVLVGAGLLAVSAVGAARRSPPFWEVRLFRIMDDRTVLPFVVLWPVMQLGNVLAIPAASMVAVAVRRLRLAIELFAGGSAAYYGAKLVKHVVRRPRPMALLGHDILRGSPSHGLGFVAGHAAVVVTLLVVTLPWLRRPALRAVCVVAAVVVCAARVYVGAHLPLDVVGGMAIGLMAGGLARLAGGRPVPAGQELQQPGAVEVEQQEASGA